MAEQTQAKSSMLLNWRHRVHGNGYWRDAESYSTPMATDRDFTTKPNQTMKKILLMALFSLVIIGSFSFAANTGKTTEISNKKARVALSGHVNLNKANTTSVKFVLPDRTYTSSCGTWTVSGSQSLATPEQEQSFCNQACANGWTHWEWDGTTLTGNP